MPIVTELVKVGLTGTNPLSISRTRRNSLVNGASSTPQNAFPVRGVKMTDPVNHPSHYTTHPSGVECIHITEHMNFCLGNAIKYIWRAGLKGERLEDLKKAQFYLNREIALAESREEAYVPEGTDAPGSQQVLPLERTAGHRSGTG